MAIDMPTGQHDLRKPSVVVPLSQGTLCRVELTVKTNEHGRISINQLSGQKEKDITRTMAL